MDSFFGDSTHDFKKTFKRVLKLSLLAIVIILAVILFMNSWYTVSEQKNAVVLTAGKFTDVKQAGLHFKIPFIQEVVMVDMTTKGMEIGYKSQQEQAAVENLAENMDESVMITNDFNMVSVDFYVEWRVTNPVQVVYAVEEPVTVLQNIVQSSARDIVSNYSVDSVLTDGKSEIQGKIKELINNVLDGYDIGILVTNVLIQDAEPPNEEVKLAFKAVEDAKQKKDTMLNEANKYYNENIPGARAEADRIIKSAEATKESRINEAKGQVSRFNEMFAEYINNTGITKSRMYYEVMEEILPSLKVYIDSGDNGVLKMLDINR